jgi:hypothetical protein
MFGTTSHDWYDSPAVRLRRIMSRRDPGRELGTVSDSELLRVHGEHLRTPSWWENYGGGGSSGGGAADTEPVAAIPIEDLAPHHHVGFQVVDGNGDPYPGLPYSLLGNQGEEESGLLPSNAEVRRDDVFDDGYALVLKGVDQLVWSSATAREGEAVELRGHVDGYPAGTKVEIRLFRELSETDDDVVATVESEVLEGGGVIATWTYDHEGEEAFDGVHAQVALIAELRVPGQPGWAKTTTTLRLELPGIEAAKWSRRAVRPGQEVTMRARTRGVPDGSPVTIEVFRELRTGERVLLDTFEGLPVCEGRVSAPWTYVCDPEDPNAPSEAECFFVATMEEHITCTSVSAPMWISRSVGRKRRTKKRARGAGDHE